MTVKASPSSAYESRLDIVENEALRGLFDGSERTPVPGPPASDVSISIRSGAASEAYTADLDGALYDGSERIEPEAGKRRLLASYIRAVRSVHYGEALPWEEVKTIIPNKQRFRVTDLETGLSFRAQRRAGRHHADAQPLTREDSAVMKRIYGGKWSWNRRAVLIDTGRRVIAGSMNGMPHGGDGIPDNGFSGHFCIHFQGSKVHGSGKVDIQHQLMVAKAGGRLTNWMDDASPYDVVHAFFAAIDLHEPQLLRMTFPHTEHAQLQLFIQQSERVAAIRYRLAAEPTATQDLLVLEIPVEASILLHGAGHDSVTYRFQMKRMTLTAPWRIDEVQMIS